MIGDLLLVHVRDTRSPRLHLQSEEENGTSEDAIKGAEGVMGEHDVAFAAAPEPLTSPHWVLNVYVPLYFELRKIGSSGEPSEPNPRRDELQNIFQDLVDKIGKIFNGWTEVGLVATTWCPAIWSAARGMELRWIYQHMLIATKEDSWRQRLQIAEAECEESLLAAIMYSMDFSSVPLPLTVSP